MGRRREGLDRIGRIGQHVRDVNHGSAPDGARRYRLRSDLHRIQRSHDAHGFGGDPVDRGQRDHLAVEPRNDGDARVAQLARALREQIEHRLHIGRRAADHAQDLAHRGLLRERLLRLIARLPQFDLSQLAPRDVAQRADELRHPAVRGADPDAAIEHPLVSACRVDDPVLVLEMRRAPLEVVDDGASIARVVVGVNACIPRGGRQVVAGEREERLRLLREEQLPRFDVPFVDALERSRRGKCVARLDRAHMLLGVAEALAERRRFAVARRLAVISRDRQLPLPLSQADRA